MKVAISYSGGKESALALYKAINAGHEPIALINTFNTDENRSHSHGLPSEVLERVSKSLNIPLWLIKTSGKDYAENFEKALVRAKREGAEGCVFVDIDIEGHIKWCSERCENVGIQALFPLSGKTRQAVVHELIDSGFVANISTVNTKYLSDDYLAQRITKELADKIAATGACICGENGEYHTFVSDGPIFTKSVEFSFGEKVVRDNYAMLPVRNTRKNKYNACPLICERGDNIKCDFALLVDETASLTGLLRSIVIDEALREELRFVCGIVYNLSPSFRGGMVLTENEMLGLEEITLRHKESAAATFVLPLGAQSASLAHVLRVKCKGLVRLLCRHEDAGNGVDSRLQDFANLLSGYFYYLAFRLNELEGVAEIPHVLRKQAGTQEVKT